MYYSSNLIRWETFKLCEKSFDYNIPIYAILMGQLPALGI